MKPSEAESSASLLSSPPVSNVLPDWWDAEDGWVLEEGQQRLAVKLDPSYREKILGDMLGRRRRVKQLERRLAKLQTMIKAAIKQAQAEKETLEDVLDVGQGWAMVPVVTFATPKDGTVRTARKDTWQVLRSRKLTGKDRELGGLDFASSRPRKRGTEEAQVEAAPAAVEVTLSDADLSALSEKCPDCPHKMAAHGPDGCTRRLKGKQCPCTRKAGMPELPANAEASSAPAPEAPPAAEVLEGTPTQEGGPSDSTAPKPEGLAPAPIAVVSMGTPVGPEFEGWAWRLEGSGPVMPVLVTFDGQADMVLGPLEWDDVGRTLAPTERMRWPARWDMEEALELHQSFAQDMVAVIHKALDAARPEGLPGGWRLSWSDGWGEASGARVCHLLMPEEGGKTRTYGPFCLDAQGRLVKPRTEEGPRRFIVDPRNAYQHVPEETLRALEAYLDRVPHTRLREAEAAAPVAPGTLLGKAGGEWRLEVGEASTTGVEVHLHSPEGIVHGPARYVFADAQLHQTLAACVCGKGNVSAHVPTSTWEEAERAISTGELRATVPAQAVSSPAAAEAPLERAEHPPRWALVDVEGWSLTAVDEGNAATESTWAVTLLDRRGGRAKALEWGPFQVEVRPEVGASFQSELPATLPPEVVAGAIAALTAPGMPLPVGELERRCYPIPRGGGTWTLQVEGPRGGALRLFLFSSITGERHGPFHWEPEAAWMTPADEAGPETAEWLDGTGRPVAEQVERYVEKGEVPVLHQVDGGPRPLEPLAEELEQPAAPAKKRASRKKAAAEVGR